MSSPEVSIIMPVFNGDEYLSAAIESILSQTFKDFEFIIINDGSTDESDDIIREYAKLDPRIKYVSRCHLGLITQLNYGIDIAMGNKIARMDADDISLPDRLKKQIEHLEKNDANVCGTWYDKIDENGNVISLVELPVSDSDISLALARRCPFAHGSIVADTFLFQNTHYCSENYLEIEDYYLWTRMKESGAVMINVPEALYQHRIHQESFSQSKLSSMKKSARTLSQYYMTQEQKNIQKIFGSASINNHNLFDILYIAMCTKLSLRYIHLLPKALLGFSYKLVKNFIK
ncbi:glycosyltransferase [Planktomarina temperata]|nr:glycosyltransferase [Planktomarina temperata]